MNLACFLAAVGIAFYQVGVYQFIPIETAAMQPVTSAHVDPMACEARTWGPRKTWNNMPSLGFTRRGWSSGPDMSTVSAKSFVQHCHTFAWTFLGVELIKQVALANGPKHSLKTLRAMRWDAVMDALEPAVLQRVYHCVTSICSIDWCYPTPFFSVCCSTWSFVDAKV